MRGEDRTSQFSRIKQRPPATDFSGPKASAESLTPRRSNLAVADAVDFQSRLFSFAAALGSTLSPERMSSGKRSATAEVSALCERTVRKVQQLRWRSRTVGFPSGWRRINSFDLSTSSTICHDLEVRVQARMTLADFLLLSVNVYFSHLAVVVASPSWHGLRLRRPIPRTDLLYICAGPVLFSVATARYGMRLWSQM